MSLKEQLANDLKDAMRGGDERRKIALRMVSAAIRNAEIAAGRPLEDTGVLQILQKEVKQRHDSIDQFRKGNRPDLAEKEEAEIAVLQGYLPQQLTREEIADAARAVIAETGAAGPGDKGKVMGLLTKRLAGKAEGRAINEVVTGLLA